MLLENNRYGGRRRLAVRPFGRYVGFELAASEQAARPPNLLGAIYDPESREVGDVAALAHKDRFFTDVVLPRTEPIAKPAILYAGPALGETADGESGGVELLVSRTADDLLAQANIPTDAALQAHGLAVGFWRIFDHTEWARTVLNDPMYDGLEPFGGLVDGKPPGHLVAPEPIGDAYLPAVQTQAPDAWRGALSFRPHALPHFFRTLGLAYASAGVVVSRPAVAVFDEGNYLLRAPQRMGDEWPKPPTPSWCSKRVTTENASQQLEHVQVTFRLPLFRNLDGMTNNSLEAWTGGDSKRVPRVFRLPDAEASYRVSTAAEDGASITPEIEILPVRPDSCTDALYAVITNGGRFESGGYLRLINECGKCWIWILEISATTAAVPAQAESAMCAPESVADAFVDLGIRPDDAHRWTPVAPRQPGTDFASRPSDWEAFRTAVQAAIRAFEPFDGVAQVADRLDWLSELQRVASADNPDAEWDNKYDSAAETHRDAVQVLGLPRLQVEGDNPRFESGDTPTWRWPRPFKIPGYADRCEVAEVLRHGLSGDLSEVGSRVADFRDVIRTAWILERTPKPFARLTPVSGTHRKAPRFRTSRSCHGLLAPLRRGATASSRNSRMRA